MRSFDAGFDQIHRRRADEAADEQIDRPLVQLLRWRDLLNLSLPHHRNAIAHGHRLDLIVGHVDRRHPELALEPRDLRAHVDAELRVEVRERLVHQVGLRLSDDRPSHRYPLTLAARERTWLAVEERFQPENVGSLSHAPVDLLLRLLSQPEAEGDVVVDGQVRVERVALEDHRDVPVARRHPVDDPVPDSQHPF